MARMLRLLGSRDSGRWYLGLLLSTLYLSRTAYSTREATATTTTTATRDAYDWELPPSVFGSNGRLFAVDLAMRAVEYETSTVAIAICCSEGVVVVSTLPTSPYLPHGDDDEEEEDADAATSSESRDSQEEPKDALNDLLSAFLDPPNSLLINYQDVGVSPTLLPPFARLHRDTLAVTAGNPIHSQLLQQHLSSSSSRQSSYTATTAGTIARQLADRMQRATQQSDRMVHRASVLVWDSRGEVWRIDPTGQFWVCRAAVVGRCARATEQILLRQLGGRVAQQPQQQSEETSLPQQLQATLDTLTAKGAIILARECIRKSYQSGRGGVVPLPRMVAVVSSSSAPQHEVYTHEEVMGL